MTVRIVRLGSKRACGEGPRPGSSVGTLKPGQAAQALSPGTRLPALCRQANFSVGCYCENESRCHRSLLRALLVERGATIVP